MNTLTLDPSSPTAPVKPFGTGAWPVVPTAFHDDLRLDLPTMDAVVDFYLAAGATGLFTCSMSSEVFFLHPHERVALTRRVVERVGGRVPVIASALGGGSVTGWRDEISRLQDAGADAVVLITSLLADADESDGRLRGRLEAILEAVPLGDLGLYECPTPYKRLLSTDDLAWAARTQRFVYFKDTCQQLLRMQERIDAVAGTRMAWYNAQIQSLVASLRAGGDGFSGLAANIYPGMVGWLCTHWDSGDPRVGDVQRLLSIAEASIGPGYPSSAKLLLQHFGVPISSVSRMQHQVLTAHQTEPLVQLADYLADHGLLALTPSERLARV